jgi:hypothetical protein
MIDHHPETPDRRLPGPLKAYFISPDYNTPLKGIFQLTEVPVICAADPRQDTAVQYNRYIAVQMLSGQKSIPLIQKPSSPKRVAPRGAALAGAGSDHKEEEF